MVRKLLFALSFILGARIAQSQEPAMDFEKYTPRSTLVVPESILTRAKFPFIDVHSHRRDMGSMELKVLIDPMESMNMAVMVNLSGGNGEALGEMIRNVEKNYPDRFIVFSNVDFDGIGQRGWTGNAVRQLEEDVRNGAKGLKIFKNLGLSVSDSAGRRVPVDDPRIDPIWAKCGELGIPVLIHSADPAQFWEPHDEFNERWLELKERPGRKRSASDPVPWQQIIDEQLSVFKKHPGTRFINAHLGWYGNNLQKLGDLLDDMPNMYTEIGAVLAELGRQPRMAREFFIKYQDRILFGKDAWIPEEYFTYFRVLETADEYFDYYRKRHAFWKMYGLDLPDEVLKKLYYKNAFHIIPGIDKSLFPD
ncbi:MAG: amidohydrolase family protein [Cyclobacteriaceae bacterium]|nr:amidohydrolase family protein [Cyclobacteriaceae bacterium]